MRQSKLDMMNRKEEGRLKKACHDIRLLIGMSRVSRGQGKFAEICNSSINGTIVTIFL